MKEQVSHENNTSKWSGQKITKTAKQEKKIYFSNIISCINSERRKKNNLELMWDDQNLLSKDSGFIKEETFFIKGRSEYLQRSGSGTIATESLAK